MPKVKTFKSIKTLSKAALKGRRVLLRLDLNVPIAAGRVQNDFRIVQSLPTIKYLTDRGARVVIISHLGDAEASLKPVAEKLNKYLPVGFQPRWPAEKLIADLPEGGVILLENLRQDSGEEKNSPALAKKLTKFADLYVNDAFAECHRKHASVVGVAKLLPSYAGLLLEEEVKNLSKLFRPAKPFVAILGGAKLETKMPLIKKMLPLADHILIGGALANDLYRAKGWEIGKSLAGKPSPAFKTLAANAKIILPEIVVVSGFSIATKPANAVEKNEVIVDAAPEAIAALRPILAKAKTILWNGPIGNFEHGYGEGTKTLAKLITGTAAFSVIGGGDTVAAVEELNLLDKFDFVSTGGGAMLDFLVNGTLPGIEALKR